MTFTPVRPMLDHMRHSFENFAEAEYAAHFWERRCMKTGHVLNQFRHAYDHHQARALVAVVSPNGTHRVWVDELEKDFPPELLAITKSHAWSSGRSKTKATQAILAEMLDYREGPIVFAMNCEALAVATAWDFLRRLCRTQRVMLVADEASEWMGRWNSRTQRMKALSKYPGVVMRRILDGTPCEESPVDLFHPCDFLSKGLLAGDKIAFRNRYAQWETEPDALGNPIVKMRQVHDPRTGKVIREYPTQLGWTNLGELRERLRPFSDRVLRSDLSDAPPKVYQPRHFELTKCQRDIYDTLRAQYTAELETETFNVNNVLKRMTRLQMIARNFWPPERVGEICHRCGGRDNDCETCEGIGVVLRTTKLQVIDTQRNPAMDALVEEVRHGRGPFVIWCRFRQEVNDVYYQLKGFDVRGRMLEGGRYFGEMPEAEREANYQRFMAGELDFIVGTERSGLSRGKDLSRGRTMIYYSNEFRGRDRQQSEDRCEGVFRDVSTDVVDLIAVDTRDEDVIATLRQKRSVAAMITGDTVKDWI